MDYRDHDYILTFLTEKYGKVSVIAVNAKKSVKRFSGILELFTRLHILYTKAQKSDIYHLREASLEDPYQSIRTDILKTAYASYWSELTNIWVEEKIVQNELYNLFQYSLENLNNSHVPPEKHTILFQLKFLEIAGLSPCFENCLICNKNLEKISETRLLFDLKKGGVICSKCISDRSSVMTISKGTVKFLLFVKNSEMDKSGRIKFTKTSLEEGVRLLESFLPYHLGKELRSLKFLFGIR